MHDTYDDEPIDWATELRLVYEASKREASGMSDEERAAYVRYLRKAGGEVNLHRADGAECKPFRSWQRELS